jgi:hypothetical protein
MFATAGALVVLGVIAGALVLGGSSSSREVKASDAVTAATDSGSTANVTPGPTLSDATKAEINAEQRGEIPAPIADHAGNRVGTAWIKGPNRVDVAIPGTDVQGVEVHDDAGNLVGYMTSAAGFVPLAMVQNGDVAKVAACWHVEPLTASCASLLGEQGIQTAPTAQH